jgi:VanZ family protein
MLILLGLTFISIFNFSNQDGKASSGLSKKVARKIVDVFPYTKNLSEKTKNKIVEKTQPIIRKGAHLSIYTLVGIFIMSFISTYKIHLKYKFLISILVGLVYASSDEIHQSFIPGRTASIIDVGIDTAGVFLGIILVLIIISVYKALTEKQTTNNI